MRQSRTEQRKIKEDNPAGCLAATCFMCSILFMMPIMIYYFDYEKFDCLVTSVKYTDDYDGEWLILVKTIRVDNNETFGISEPCHYSKKCEKIINEQYPEDKNYRMCT